MSNKFETFFNKPYDEIKNVLTRVIQDNQRILDLGCNNGNLEEHINSICKKCFVYCVDNDKRALKKLIQIQNQLNNIKIQVCENDINLFLQENKIKNLDVVLVNATLHEINNFDKQDEYLDNWFKQLKPILRYNGKIIIGDYYYPKNVSDKDVKNYIEHQKKEIGHADPRFKFINPQLIKKKAKENDFKIEYFKQIKVVKGIDKKYFIFILNK